MALFGILFLTLCFTFCFVSSEATVSVKEAKSLPYTVLVVLYYLYRFFIKFFIIYMYVKSYDRRQENYYFIRKVIDKSTKMK